MKRFLFLSAALWGALLPSSAIAARAADRPNVVLVMSDDQGYGDLHCHGNPVIRTPHLDTLHGESVRLTNFHVDPTCSPTRSALMTGRYSTRTGCWHTIMGRSLLFHGEVTMGDVFRRAGYRTAVFGKWHLGDNYPMRPQDRGFDETLVHGGGGITQTPDFWGNDYFDDTYWHNGRLEPQQGYCTDVFFAAAAAFIKANRERPFFVYLPTNVPHSPYNVAEDYSRYYREAGVAPTMANFYGMIENLDENIGRLRDLLGELGLEQNTIFIFMTDNGTAEGAGPRRNETASWDGFNAGMRGQKGSQYDGGHRVPFFIHWPAGGLAGGREVDRLTAHFDVLPTLADLCGIEVPARVALDGSSLAPLLRGTAVDWPERTLFAHVQRQEIPPKWVRSTAMTDRWRLVDGKELYDMPEDPGQRHDVASAHPEVVARLRAAFEAWWATLEPSFDHYGYLVLGAEAADPVDLTCHDWHSNQVPWHQGMIRAAPWANGDWVVLVTRPGRYEFTLRQQPREAAFPIQASRARVKLDDVEAETAIPEGAASVRLTLDLRAGPGRLQTWFTDGASGRSRGAFFVSVRRLSDAH